MARPGDVIESRVLGERVIFHRTANDTNGELLQLEGIAKPAASTSATASARSCSLRTSSATGTRRVPWQVPWLGQARCSRRLPPPPARQARVCQARPSSHLQT